MLSRQGLPVGSRVRETGVARLRRLGPRLGLGLAVAFLGGLVLTGAAARAQTATPRPVQLDPPVIKTIDARGVDLVSGSFMASPGSVSIGDPSDLGLWTTYQETLAGAHKGYPTGSLAANDHYTSGGYTLPCCFKPVASFSEGTTRFQGMPSASAPVGYLYNNYSGTAATLENQGASTLKYTTRDGTVVYYLGTSACAKIARVVRPNGETLTYGPGNVWSNAGYMMRIATTFASCTSGVVSNSTIDLINTSVNYCDVQTSVCTLNRTWPSITMASSASGGTTTFASTDSLTYPRSYTVGGITLGSFGGYVQTITQPSGIQVTATSALYFGGCYGGQSYEIRVVSVVVGGQTWTYDYSDKASACANQNRTVTVTDPLNHHTTIVVAGAPTAMYPDSVASIVSITDPLGHATLYEGRIDAPTKVTHPEGNYEQYEYDARLNVTKTTFVAKPNSGVANRVIEASYDATCANIKTCNKPNYTIDANLNRTDYTYDPDHGGVLTETGPADANGVRPQTRYTYTALYAKVLNSAGALVNADTPIYRLTKISKCASSQNACAGTLDEQVAVLAYDSNNLLLTSKTTKDKDGNLTLVTSYGYDDYGNRIWTDGPRTDVDDRAYTTYDILRRPVFEIAPDPDGASPLKRRVVHHLYNGDGAEIRTEEGVGAATDGSDFLLKSYKTTTYDATTGLPVKTIVAQP